MKENNPNPPKFIYWILTCFCKPEVLEIVAGDLFELYERRLLKMGKKKADWYFTKEVLSLFRMRLVKSLEGTQNLNTYGMFKHNFRIAWRNLIRNRSHSFLNIAGLSVGMACSILILLWIQNELSYDKFHTDSQKIYRLTCDVSGSFKAAVSPAGMPRGLKNELPEILDYVRISKPSHSILSVGKRQFEKQYGFFADSNFLSFFDFPLVEGAKKDILNDPNSILISETAARRYFGMEDAVGQILRQDNAFDFIVRGILKDAPVNSHLQYDFILPISALIKDKRSYGRDVVADTWSSFNFHSYLKLHQTAETLDDLARLDGKVTNIYTERFSGSQLKFHLQPLEDIHLHSDLQIDVAGHGNAQYVQIFSIVTLFILIIACINFMNLATAQSAKRAKEVGVRKVVGVSKWQLIKQFLFESMLVSYLSVVLALILVYLSLPAFNDLIGKTLDFSLFDIRFLVALLAIALLTGLLSGSYPSIFLSSFKPLLVLKGSFTTGRGGRNFRNTLVVVQFFVSITLLVGIVVVYSQLSFIKEKNLGFEKSNLLYLPVNKNISAQYNAFRSELSRNSLSSDFTVVSELPAEIVSGTLDVDWEGKDDQLNNLVVPDFTVDHHFIDLFKIELLSGRDFSKDLKSDSSSFIINEKLAGIMGLSLEDCIGKKLKFHGQDGIIIGVVKNFNFKPLQYEIDPLVLRLGNQIGYFVVRTQPGRNQETISSLKELYASFDPGQPLSFGFLDQELDNLYQAERQMGKIFNLFGVLAIFISCLGLYGLAAFVAEQHTKELGIRKVLGASIWSLANLLSIDFVKLVVIATIIALPTAWYFMNQWLSSFAYHISISWWTLMGASIVTLLITLLTVSYQILKATSRNPVESLRAE